MSQTRAQPRLEQSRPAPMPWDDGGRPGRQVLAGATAAVLGVAALNLALTADLSLFFDLTFVVLCLVAALSVRRYDFFVVGVLPPLLMLTTVSLLAMVARSAVADEVDSYVQAVVSGLAHHAGALVGGYALTLIVLGVRQLAARELTRSAATHR